MKLWHDDIRPAPQGWIWVRTNEEAIEHLKTGAYTHISMDHDLGLDQIDPNENPEAIFFAGRSEAGNGKDLARWIAEHADFLNFQFVRVHSWNPDGAKEMADILNDAGITVYIMPFSTDWYGSEDLPRQFESFA